MWTRREDGNKVVLGCLSVGWDWRRSVDAAQYRLFLGKVLPRLIMSLVLERPPLQKGGPTRSALMQTVRRGYSGLSRAPGSRVMDHTSYSFYIMLCYSLDWLDVPLEHTPERILREVLTAEFPTLKHHNDLHADGQFTPRPLSLLTSWTPHFDASVPASGGDLVRAHAKGQNIPCGRRILLGAGQGNCIAHYYCVGA
jgi:hypothetical protein